MNGHGTYYWKDGHKYVGNWEDSRRHGHGEEINDSSLLFLKYKGSWLNGTKSGNGSLFWTDGCQYTGNFENDFMHGFGIIVFAKRNDNKSPFKYEGKKTFIITWDWINIINHNYYTKV